MSDKPKSQIINALPGSAPIVSLGDGLSASVPLPTEEEVIEMMKVWWKLSALGDPVVVAENIGELVGAAERAAKCIEDNVWRQREKAADAAPLLRAALAKLKDRPNGDTNG